MTDRKADKIYVDSTSKGLAHTCKNTEYLSICNVCKNVGNLLECFSIPAKLCL